MERTAHIFGATGLVGGELMRQCLEDDSPYRAVHVYVRRPIELRHERLIPHVVDYDTLGRERGALTDGDVFCCLGTTIKTAKTREAFDLVDRIYPIRIAAWAKEDGARRLLVVSALGADKHSRFFYNRVKGCMEEDVQAAGPRTVTFFRPSLLLGDRTETRFGEKFGATLSRLFPFLFVGSFARYRPVQAHDVAAAMLAVAMQDESGIRRVESYEIPVLTRAKGRILQNDVE